MITTRQLCDLAEAITNVCEERDRLATEVHRLQSDQQLAAVDYRKFTEMREQLQGMTELQHQHDLLKKKFEEQSAINAKLRLRLSGAAWGPA